MFQKLTFCHLNPRGAKESHKVEGPCPGTRQGWVAILVQI